MMTNPQTLTLSYVNGLLNKYPDKVPVVVYAENDKTTPFKLLVSPNLTIGEFMNMLRAKKLNDLINKHTSLYLFVNDPHNNANVMTSISNTIGNVYHQYQQSNKTLVVTYGIEHVFG